MSRNLARVDCQFCRSTVTLEEKPRPITESEAGAYFPQYEGMRVANALCSYCGARYLAWIDYTWTGYGIGPGDTHGDLSFRSTFDDEPGESDKPGGGVVTSIRVEHGPSHDRVSIWNRGGLAGTLTVQRGDGDAVAQRLMPWAEPPTQHAEKDPP